MGIDKKLGTLENVPLRYIWEHEALDFTPWLSDKRNIQLLGDTLGINIEVIEQERYVGQFRSDIYAREGNTGESIIIENQLETSDHNHLGQVITYAAGLETGIIIWLSPHFREEHRAAIDWLNRTTNEHTNFFAIEIELWKIGDSLPAPKFNIVAKPNEWINSFQSTVRKTQINPTLALCQEYWMEFKSFIESSGSGIRLSTPSAQTSIHALIGKSPFKITAIITPDQNTIRALLWISDASGGTSRQELFTLLKEKYGGKLREIFGDNLDWNSTKGWDEVFIKTTFDLKDRSSWSQQNVWLKTHIEKMIAFFDSNLKEITTENRPTGKTD